MKRIVRRSSRARRHWRRARSSAGRPRSDGGVAQSTAQINRRAQIEERQNLGGGIDRRDERGRGGGTRAIADARGLGGVADQGRGGSRGGRRKLRADFFDAGP